MIIYVLVYLVKRSIENHKMDLKVFQKRKRKRFIVYKEPTVLQNECFHETAPQK